jgi:multidrug transporter EmrE-like cation transporter
MSSYSLALILTSVCLSALAQLALKISSLRHAAGTHGTEHLLPGLLEQLLRPWGIAAVLGYGMGFILWILALREVPLTVAYPFMGLSLALVAILGVVVLGESLGAAKIAGMLFIVVGLVLIARS